jgi:hypothetical protein
MADQHLPGLAQQAAHITPFVPASIFALSVAMIRARSKPFWRMVSNGLMAAATALVVGPGVLELYPDKFYIAFGLSGVLCGIAPELFDILVAAIAKKFNVKMKSGKAEAE